MSDKTKQDFLYPIKIILYNTKYKNNSKESNDIVLDRQQTDNVKMLISNLNTNEHNRGENALFVCVPNSFPNLKAIINGLDDNLFKKIDDVYDYQVNIIENNKKDYYMTIIYNKINFKVYGIKTEKNDNYVCQIVIFETKEMDKKYICIVNLLIINTMSIEVNNNLDKFKNNENAEINITKDTHYKYIICTYHFLNNNGKQININIHGKTKFNVYKEKINEVIYIYQKLFVLDYILNNNNNIILKAKIICFNDGIFEDQKKILTFKEFLNGLNITLELTDKIKEEIKKQFITLVNNENDISRAIHFIKNFNSNIVENDKIKFLIKYSDVKYLDCLKLISLSDTKLKFVNAAINDIKNNILKYSHECSGEGNKNTFNKLIRTKQSFYFDFENCRGFLFNKLVEHFFKDNYIIKHKNDLTSITDDTTKYKGIINNGATCFFATFIQALNDIKDLKDHIAKVANEKSNTNPQRKYYVILNDIIKKYNDATVKANLNFDGEHDSLNNAYYTGKTKRNDLFSKSRQNDPIEVFTELFGNDFNEYLCKRDYFNLSYHGYFKKEKHVLYSEFIKKNLYYFNIYAKDYKNKSLLYAFAQQMNIIENRMAEEKGIMIYLCKFLTNHIFISINRNEENGKKDTSKILFSPILFNKGIFYKILCVMLHTGTTATSGHHEYIAFNTNGKVKCVCNDNNIITDTSQFDNYINIIQEHGTYFIYEKIIYDRDKKPFLYDDIISEYNRAIQDTPNERTSYIDGDYNLDKRTHGDDTRDLQEAIKRSLVNADGKGENTLPMEPMEHIDSIQQQQLSANNIIGMIPNRLKPIDISKIKTMSSPELMEKLKENVRLINTFENQTLSSINTSVKQQLIAEYNIVNGKIREMLNTTVKKKEYVANLLEGDNTIAKNTLPDTDTIIITIETTQDTIINGKKYEPVKSVYELSAMQIDLIMKEIATVVKDGNKKILHIHNYAKYNDEYNKRYNIL